MGAPPQGFASPASVLGPGHRAINVLRVAAAVQDAETVTIGADVYEFDTHSSPTITGGRIRVDVSGGGTVKAAGTFVLVANAGDGKKVTIDGRDYVFQTTLTDVSGHVKIGASAAASITSLIAAIMLGAGAGTAYAASTTVNTSVSAAQGAGTTAVVTALAGGTAGNSMAVSTDVVGASWDGVTLGTTVAGVDPTAGEATTALVSAITASTTEAIAALRVSANEVVVSANAVGAVVLACAESMGGSNNAWAASAMYGGRAVGPRTVEIQNRVPLAVEVAVDNMHFYFSFTPAAVEVFVEPTSTPGALKLWNGGATISGGRVTLDNGGNVDWAATDTVYITATD